MKSFRLSVLIFKANKYVSMKSIAVIPILFLFFQIPQSLSQAAVNIASLKNFEDLYNSHVTSGFELDDKKKGTPYFLDQWLSARISFPDSSVYEKNVRAKLDINRGIVFIENGKKESIAIQPFRILGIELTDDAGAKHLFRVYQINPNQPVDYCEALFESNKLKVVCFHSKYFKHAEVEQHGMDSETVPEHYESRKDAYYIKTGANLFTKFSFNRNDFIEQFNNGLQLKLKDFCQKNNIGKQLDTESVGKMCTYIEQFM